MLTNTFSTFLQVLSFFFLATGCLADCDDKWSVQLQDSSTPLDNNFDATITGSGGPYQINIQGNTGTVTQGSRVTNVVIDYQIPWQQGGDGSPTTELYAFIGADSQGLMMGWAYCHGNTLTDVWLESTTGQSDFTNPKITGTCSVSSDSKDVTLSTTSQCYTIDPPPNYPSITAKGLVLNNGDTGMVLLGGNEYSLLPFANIDCTTCKDDAYPGGWYELHAVMKSAGNVCMGIYYLPVQQTSKISLNYVNCVAQQVTNTDFTGTFTMNAPQVVSSSATTAAAATTAASSSSSVSVSSSSSSSVSLTTSISSGTSAASTTAGSSSTLTTSASTGTDGSFLSGGSTGSSSASGVSTGTASSSSNGAVSTTASSTTASSTGTGGASTLHGSFASLAGLGLTLLAFLC